MRLQSHHPLVPLALGVTFLVVAALTSIVAPAFWSGPATLALLSGAILLAFIRLPKPTLFVFALFVLFYDTFARWLTPSVRQIDEVLVPAMFVIAAWRTKPWQRGLIDRWREGAAISLVAIAVVSSFVNGVPTGVWLIGLLGVVKVIAFLYVVLWYDFDRRDIVQFAPLLMGVASVVLALAAVEFVDPLSFQRALNLTEIAVPRGQLPSLKSLFFHPVLFAWFTAFVGLFLLAAYVVYRRWWLLLAGAVFSLGTILGGRRRSIAGLVVGLVGGLARSLVGTGSRRAAVRAWLPIGAATLLLMLVFLPGLIGLVKLTIDQTPQPGSDPEGAENSARIALYVTSVDVARDNFPLGAGLGRYGSPMSRDVYSPLYERYGLSEIRGLGPSGPNFITDTFWPSILGETGVFGLAAYLVFVAALGVGLWRAAHDRYADPLLRAFQLGTWMVFLEALLETLASSMFNSPPRVYLLFGAVAMALSLGRTELESARERSLGSST